ncbi:endothelin-2-like [Oncorhynchus nerka]|uniref:endothelin-2-like n=1 Tax=Oncorhynchus nerka TaxID=8023 RepID=UPI001131F9FF|nr:endothelin-2-like [Oncorhynchus nerka]
MDLRIFFSVLSIVYSGIVQTVTSAPMVKETAVATPATPVPVRHIRNKRCSCATFLDKECVYFCHLDIIWVNTPERVVSYGLGNASRKKRAIKDPEVSQQDPRCKCVSEDDGTCIRFCQLENHLRYGTAAVIRPASDTVIRRVPDTVIRPASDTVIRPVPDTVIRPVPDTAIRPVPDTVISRVPDTVIRPTLAEYAWRRQCKLKLAAKTSRIQRVKHRDHKAVGPSALRATVKACLLLEKWMVKQRHKPREGR